MTKNIMTTNNIAPAIATITAVAIIVLSGGLFVNYQIAQAQTTPPPTNAYSTSYADNPTCGGLETSEELACLEWQMENPKVTTPTTPSLQTPYTATAPAPFTLPATTDPELQRIRQIANDCNTTIQRMYPGAQIAEQVILKPPQNAVSADYEQMRQCNKLLNQAVAQYCNILATYDAAKCAYVQRAEITNIINISYTIATQQFLYDTERTVGGILSSSP